jgi:ABC-type histidine transport system ATPase subunit
LGRSKVLRGVSFDVHRGNVVSVIGASGSGKTLLRCVNYLERPNVGEVYLEGEPLGSRLDASGRRRNMTVLGNVVEAPIGCASCGGMRRWQ